MNRSSEMRTQSLKAGDVVELDIRGQSEWAVVTSRPGNEVLVRIIAPYPGTTRSVSARQIVGAYGKRKGSR